MNTKEEHDQRLDEIRDELWEVDGKWYTGKGLVPPDKVLSAILKQSNLALLSRVKDSLPSQSKYKTPDSYKKAVRTKLDQLRKERI